MSRNKTLLWVVVALIYILPANLQGQQLYSLDVSKDAPAPIYGQLNMGSSGQGERQIKVNNQYLTIGGKPLLPVMGEVHFTRVPRANWDDVLLKMKACGVNIVACYVLWNHHERQEGVFDWSGNMDLRAFIEKCQAYGLYAYPRIGPWCHAEVRNGGTPDWLLAKTDIKIRSNDPKYQHYVKILYKQIAEQLKGLLYKDGGPVIGVQLENEYRHGKAGEAHIKWLKKAAISSSIDVPLYTVTGWGNASVPAKEVIPLYGAYPDEPWATNLKRNTSDRDFRFSPYRNNQAIGNEAGLSGDGDIISSLYPYFTCEMGVGIENTEHRRLKISNIDGKAIMMAKLGSGSNLIGYYMFAGGSNPHDQKLSLEETQISGSWNTNPAISYDFQGAIRETGALGPSYNEIKPIHYFLNTFGGRLATMTPVFNQEKKQSFQYSFRGNGKQGFLFAINYARHQERPEVKKAQFALQLKTEKLLFPSTPIDLPDSSLLLWPVNFDMDGINLKYATAMPLTTLKKKTVKRWVFSCDVTDQPEFCLSDQNIKSVKAEASITHHGGHYLIHDFNQEAPVRYIEVQTTQGKHLEIVLLSKEVTPHAWVTNINDPAKRRLYLSDAGLYEDMKGSLHLFGPSPAFNLTSLDDIKIYRDGKALRSRKNNGLYYYTLHKAQQKALAEVRPLKALDDAQYLKVKTPHVRANDTLQHRYFLKRIALDRKAAIRRVTMKIAAAEVSNILVNHHKVNQKIQKNALTTLDLTGYFKKGINDLLISLPVSTVAPAFAASIEVIYENNDREAYNTDSSWRVQTVYAYPAYPYNRQKFKAVTLTNKPTSLDLTRSDNHRYLISLKADKKLLEHFRLRISYKADKAKLYDLSTGYLVADDFYNGEDWQVDLGRIQAKSEAQFLLILSPLEPDARIYFDEQVDRAAMQKTELKEVKLQPVYKATLNVQK